MTQSDFGALFNYHHPQIRISEFERGERKIPARVAEAIAYMKLKSHFLEKTA